MIESIHDRLVQARQQVQVDLRPKCHHCFHSISERPWRWRCCLCADRATKALPDYYATSQHLGDGEITLV